MSKLRVALVYPPPWKIPDAHATVDPVDGPPADFTPNDLDTDFFQIPYGLLSLAAQTVRSGHAVKVLNLSGHPWSEVEETVRHLDADVLGLSCWTANRRGVHLVAKLAKSFRPKLHVVVGGPHVTPLGREFLEHDPAIDSAVVGEGELTFLELLDRLSHSTPLDDLKGAFVRQNERILPFLPRASALPLDELESPHQHFPSHIVMTSRGCPWACTFCGAASTWGRGFRSFSVDRILDDLEAALERVRVRVLLIKDDTFTTRRERVLQVCQGIRDRKLRFLWSCDTRVDVLDETLMREMRLAGCERMSFGIESGSPRILKAIHKNLTQTQILESTALARRYGISTRFYMMLGNRGETRETLEETLAFLRRAQPHQYIFSCLSIYPGTLDYADAVGAGWLDPETYFAESFQELKAPFDASVEDTALMRDWFARNRGLHIECRPTVHELRLVAQRLGDTHAPSLLDLAEALIEQGSLDEAELVLESVNRYDHPLPGLVHNARACLAAARNDLATVKGELLQAARTDPQHYVLLQNAALAKRWFESGPHSTELRLSLQARHDFQLFERTEQPSLPGPIAKAWLNWSDTNPVTLLPSEI